MTYRRPMTGALATVALVCTGISAAPAGATITSTEGMAPAQGVASLAGCPSSPVTPHASPMSSELAVPGVTVGQSGVQIPRDEAPHHDPVEWWYFSGHLRGTDAAGHVHCYGFEYVTFQLLGMAPVPVYVGDFAVTDLTRGTFHYAAKEDIYSVPTTKNGFSLHTGGWTMVGADGRDVLRAAIPGYTMDLQLRSSEPPVLEGTDGVVSLGLIGTSKYYSWTSLLTTGTMRDHGVAVKLTGLSWMDHQWGTMDITGSGGWDWFSVQLSNGQQYMLYFIRNSRGRIVDSFGNHVSSAGQVTHLGAMSERATGSWHSPATSITYGSGWQLTVPGGHLDIKPDVRNQELDLKATQGNSYWEGDVSVEGQVDGAPVAGVGYTELNPPGR
jgi:predicted secreted hydrolase